MDKNDVSYKMSDRLIAVADLLGSGEKELLKVADIGCDHGYVSIYLMQRGIAKSVVAMDVKRGPLSSAAENIAEYGLCDRISIRLSDGLKELHEGEADSLVIAGMGGKLMERLIDEADMEKFGIKTAVFQPQSDIFQFRHFIRKKGFVISDERVVLEDGKYYFPMKVRIFRERSEGAFAAATADLDFEAVRNRIFCDFHEALPEQQIRVCNRYGEYNLLKKEPLLLPYLEHGREVLESILKNLDGSHKERMLEVKEELSDIACALEVMNR